MDWVVTEATKYEVTDDVLPYRKYTKKARELMPPIYPRHQPSPNPPMEIIDDDPRSFEKLRYLELMFYECIQNGEIDKARCIAGQFALNNTSGWKGLSALNDMLVTLFRRSYELEGTGLVQLHSRRSTTDHSDYAQILAEGGLNSMAAAAARLTQEQRRNYKFMPVNDNLEAVMLSFIQLEEKLLNGDHMLSSQEISSVYELIRSKHHLSFVYRGKCLLLLGLVERAAKIYVENYNQNKHIPQSALHLLKFVQCREQLQTALEPPNSLNHRLVDAPDESELLDAILDLDPVNELALNQSRITCEEPIKIFERLWDAIEISDQVDQWKELISVLSANYTSEEFLSAARDYCLSFLAYMPIHISIFDRVNSYDEEELYDDDMNATLLKAVALCVLTKCIDATLIDNMKQAISDDQFSLTDEAKFLFQKHLMDVDT